MREGEKYIKRNVWTGREFLPLPLVISRAIDGKNTRRYFSMYSEHFLMTPMLNGFKKRLHKLNQQLLLFIKKPRVIYKKMDTKKTNKALLKQHYFHSLNSTN